jgi:predicted MFS family arabinose efflux permease
MPVFSISRVQSSKDKTSVPIRKIMTFGALALVMSAGPSADPMLTVVLGQQFGFHRKAFAAMALLECVTMTLGSVLYKLYVRHKPPRTVVIAASASMACASLLLMTLFLTRTFPQAFAAAAAGSILYLLSSSFLSSVLLCEAARGLPKGSEASFFSAIAACFNLGGIVSTLTGGALAQRFSPRAVLGIEAAGNLLYLLSLFIIRSETSSDPEGDRAPAPEPAT